MAELLSIREALSWLKTWNVQRAVVESDALNVVSTIKFIEEFSNYAGVVLDECRSLVSEFKLLEVLYARRPANSVANLLAKASLSISGPKLWSVSPPYFICNSLFFLFQLMIFPFLSKKI